MNNLELTQVWDKKFPQSDKVNHRKVTFKTVLASNLQPTIALSLRGMEDKSAALAIAGPFGAVKEMVTGRYAQAMAERGFVTIAFDPSFYRRKRRSAT